MAEPHGVATAVSTACPPFIAAFIADYIIDSGRDPQVVIDLWAEPGGLLASLTAQLAPTSSVGVIGDSLEPAPQPGVRWHCGAPDDLLDTWLEPLDLVVGIPPWYWHPQRRTLDDVDTTIEITDDPANIALVRACRRLTPDGLAMVVAAPGFVLRPGPHTALPMLTAQGICVEALVQLPRGVFRCDGGAGRWLVGLGRRPHTRPMTGLLRDSGHSDYDLLRTW